MAVFRLIDAPGEIRNQVFSHMVELSRSLEKRTGNVPDGFLNPAFLCTNHQVNNEDSSIIYGKMIVIRVSPMPFRSLVGRNMNLPKGSGFKRCM